MKNYNFVAIKYKYEECPVCFPRDPDAGIAFIEDILDPREMRNLAVQYQLTIIYDKDGQFKGTMYTHKANHQVSFVAFCEKSWHPTKSDFTTLIYHNEIYDCSEKEIANFLVDEDFLIRDYAERVHKLKTPKIEDVLTIQ